MNLPIKVVVPFLWAVLMVLTIVLKRHTGEENMTMSDNIEEAEKMEMKDVRASNVTLFVFGAVASLTIFLFSLAVLMEAAVISQIPWVRPIPGRIMR